MGKQVLIITQAWIKTDAMLRQHSKYPFFNVGRKGSVIFYAWHDIPCMRQYTKPRNPQTPCQQANRNLHGQLTALSGITKDFRKFCYDGLPSYRSSHTAFIGIQMYQLNHTQRKLSLPLEAQIHWGNGTLPGTNQATFSRKGPSLLTWHLDKANRYEKPGDRVLWIAWNARRNAWCWSLNAGKRQDGKSRMNLPKEWNQEELYLWLLFYDEKKKQFSCDTCLHIKEKEEKTCVYKESQSNKCLPPTPAQVIGTRPYTVKRDKGKGYESLRSTDGEGYAFMFPT